MTPILIRNHIAFAAIILLQFFTPNLSEAMSETDYKAALQIAEKKALRTRDHFRNKSLGLSTETASGIFGRNYNEGDHWDVAVWRINHSTMKMTGDPKQLQDKFEQSGIFRYTVVRHEEGSHSKLILQITQLKSNDSKRIDPRIASLFLTMENGDTQSRKAYHFNGTTKEVAVSSEGIHSRMTTLELLPLDFPELGTAVKFTPKTLPQIPPTIQETVKGYGFNLDLSQSQQFEQDDFFGRPIQVIWQKGDPWPAFIRTSGGISILIRKGAL